MNSSICYQVAAILYSHDNKDQLWLSVYPPLFFSHQSDRRTPNSSHWFRLPCAAIEVFPKPLEPKHLIIQILKMYGVGSTYSLSGRQRNVVRVVIPTCNTVSGPYIAQLLGPWNWAFKKKKNMYCILKGSKMSSSNQCLNCAFKSLFQTSTRLSTWDFV